MLNKKTVVMIIDESGSSNNLEAIYIGLLEDVPVEIMKNYEPCAIGFDFSVGLRTIHVRRIK